MSDSVSPTKPVVSRRTALTAVVGLGATVAISSVTYVASAKEDDPKISGPVVVHVKDLSSGRLEIFTAGRRIEVKDKDLAVALVRAAVKA